MSKKIKLPSKYRFRKSLFGKVVLQVYEFLPECWEGSDCVREAQYIWRDAKIEEICQCAG